MRIKSYRQAIILVAGFASALASGYAFHYRIAPVVDAQAYDRIAVNIQTGHGFREDSGQSYQFDQAIVRAGPGYEYFLAALYAIFGHHYEVVWIIQAVLHGLSVLLLYEACRTIFTDKGQLIGLTAGFLFGFNPDLIEISAMLMTETLYLFLIILVTYLFAKCYQKPQRGRWHAALGLTAGLAILTRPPVLFFVPAIILVYFYGKEFRRLAYFLSALILAIVPWTMRNYFVYHQLILTTLIGEYNLWIGNTLTATGGQFAGGVNPLTTYAASHGYGAVKTEASRAFWFFVSHYPLQFVKLCFYRTVRFFSIIRPMGFWFYQTGRKLLLFVTLSGIGIVMLFVSGFSGMIAAARERRSLFYYLIYFAALSPLTLILTVAESRYRFQIYPFLALFGSYCLVRLASARSGRDITTVVGVTSLLVVISAIDAALFWPVVVEHLRLFIQ